MKLILIGVALLTFSAAQKAEAQGFIINPFFTTTLTSPSGGGHTKPGVGLAFGTNGKILGFETEIAYHPQIIDTALDGSKSKVLTFSGDLIVGPTIGHVKGYGAVGGGDLHLNVKSLKTLASTDVNSLASNYFTFNVGGGAIYYLTDHLGIRGDLRYLRAYGIDFAALEAAEASDSLSLKHFDFWRLNIGLAAKF
jgi:opacity protein-like surface antigen